MTIAEKLQKIAEDMQQVYDAGYEQGKADCGVKLITFTIAGSEYQALEGMTWSCWLESEFNTDQLVRNGYGKSNTVVAPNGITIMNPANDPVLQGDLIVSGTAYTTDWV